jgi:hypothetical protein
MSRILFTLTALLTLSAAAAGAQQMPDPSQMAGVPLPAPELADGSVSVRLMREQIGNNIAGHPVTLTGAGITKTAQTDAQGRALFTDFAPGTAVKAQAVVDGETLQSQEFTVPNRAGIRVALISGLKAAADRERAAAEAGAKEPPRPGIVTFGGESRIIAEFQDDNLQVFYILDVVNGARTPIDIGGPLIIELPREAVSATIMEGSSRLASVNGRFVTVRGPFPPGTTPVQIGYTMPTYSDTVTIEQRWPAALEQIFVAVEKVGALKIASAQLPEQQEAAASGQTFVMGRGSRLNAGQPLTLTLSGLPHRSTALRNGGVAVAALVLGLGAWAAFTGAPVRRAQTAHLDARREKLFNELVELERQHKTGRVDESRYAAKRSTLMTQLERVLGQLDRSPSSGGRLTQPRPRRSETGRRASGGQISISPG